MSRAQWSIDAYCQEVKEGKCKPCEKGWLHLQSSCYAYNDAKTPNQRSFDEAQQDCHGKASHLIVVNSQEEKGLSQYNQSCFTWDYRILDWPESC